MNKQEQIEQLRGVVYKEMDDGYQKYSTDELIDMIFEAGESFAREKDLEALEAIRQAQHLFKQYRRETGHDEITEAVFDKVDLHIANAIEALQPKEASTPNTSIGETWQETAAGRVRAGEPIDKVMLDYGWAKT